ncbi:hypothetical protein [Falsirhodobacter halotolerans]|uniref:hypothetical protein n=1 Tax=Falsirhodobacter halotolerans TaxID=1146892 RepID=UPI001FD5EE93|nr:hypothetical protein [Falsirhodobacter halotolerans]MCJ8139897.1 hypothetical protein [Falsirhodobacter halotolerans]
MINERRVDTPLIVFDPLEKLDLRFVEDWALEAYPNAILHRSYLTGHKTIRHYGRVGILSNFVRTFLSGAIPSETENVWEAGTPTHHLASGHAYKFKGDAQNAMQQFAMGMRLAPSVANISQVIRLASSLNDAEAVREAVSIAQASEHWAKVHHKVKAMARIA